VVVTEFGTLDGVTQAPGGRDEDLDGGLCSRCCALASSTGWAWGGSRCCSAAARRCSKTTLPTARRLIESATHANGTLHLAYQTVGAPHMATSQHADRVYRSKMSQPVW